MEGGRNVHPSPRKWQTATRATHLARPRKPGRTLSLEGDAVIGSDDGNVQFRIAAAAGSVCVQRDRCLDSRGTRLVATVLFSNLVDFESWCESDPVRFEHPLAAAQVRRTGLAIFEILAKKE